MKMIPDDFSWTAYAVMLVGLSVLTLIVAVGLKNMKNLGSRLLTVYKRDGA